MLSIAEAFKLLNLETLEATQENERTVKKAFKKLALEYHPDKNQGKDTAEYEEKMKALNEAKEVLGRYFSPGSFSHVSSSSTSTSSSSTYSEPSSTSGGTWWQSPFNPKAEVDSEYLFQVIEETLMHNVYRASDTADKLRAAGYNKDVFNVINDSGDTPLHAAAKKCNTRSSSVLFASLVYQAAELGFDFSTKNTAGMTVEEVLQHSARSPILAEDAARAANNIIPIAPTIYAVKRIEDMIHQMNDMPKGIRLMKEELQNPSMKQASNKETMQMFQRHAENRDTWKHFSSWGADDSTKELYKAIQNFSNDNKASLSRLITAINTFQRMHPQYFQNKKAEKFLALDSSSAFFGGKDKKAEVGGLQIEDKKNKFTRS